MTNAAGSILYLRALQQTHNSLGRVSAEGTETTAGGGNSSESLSAKLILKGNMTSSSSHIGKIQPYMFEPPETVSYAETEEPAGPLHSA